MIHGINAEFNTVSNAIIDWKAILEIGVYASSQKAEFGMNIRSHLTEQYLKDKLFVYVVMYQTNRPQINVT